MNSNRCQQVEKLLIKKNIESLSDDEEQLIRTHLKECADCRSFQFVLAGVKKKMGSEFKSDIKPKPSIRLNLVRQIRKSANQEQSMLAKIWHKILAALEYRVPVYQGLLGAAVVLLIFLILNQFSYINNQSFVNFQQYAQTDTVLINQMNVIDDVSILKNQKIGQSVSEDTMLTKFLHSAL